ncbi:hypothetical protein VTN96DRAFT_7556 [Rasamsonia emersonii]
MILVSTIFLRIIPTRSSYAPLPHHDAEDGSSTSRGGRRSLSVDDRHVYYGVDETGTLNRAFAPQSQTQARSSPPASSSAGLANRNADTDETSSLVSKTTTPRESEDRSHEAEMPAEMGNSSHYPDVRGLALLSKLEFWQLFLIMGLLSGIGLMTINNIGNNTKALWKYYDDSVDSIFIHHRQVVHVSTLSICSFIGRLLSGVGSDLLVKKLQMSRFWCLFISAAVFTMTQMASFSISNPHHLIVVSSATGLAYGFLFGVFPSLVAHTFGIAGLSQNWGVMTLAPVISGNVFNLLYGTIYDHHSVISPKGERDCTEGLRCYRAAYYVTFFSGLAGLLVCLWSIWQEKRVHRSGSVFVRKPGQHERIA